MAASKEELIVYRRKRLKSSTLSDNSSEKAEKRKQKQLKSKKATENQPSKALTVVRGANGPWRLLPSSGTTQRAGWGTFRVGTSGYVYKDWKNIIYPEDASPKEWFHLYARLFDTVEINNTFYRLPSVNVMDMWRSQASPGFCYALKFSRFGTHMKRLKDPEQSISLFLERAIQLGKEFIGPILVQLPPNFNLNVERLREFLEKAPQQYRWAIEFRDSSWLCDEIYSLLRDYKASLCIHDHKDISCTHPKVFTTNWVYVRFHGYDYCNCYEREQLQTYAVWIRDQLARGLDVYAYFNNDYNGHAPYNALDLRELVYK